jgi:nitronate monooxygenase
MSLSELLKIGFPVIQAPMAGVQNWELAVSVSEAGGLGSIPCGMLTPEKILGDIESYRSHSKKPFNLNFFCHEMPGVNNQKMKVWESRLRRYYDFFEVSPPSEMGTLRLPFDEALADLLEPEKPPIISFHFGLPSRDLIERIHSWGTVVISSATTVEEGIWLEASGADIVIAQGIEAGGHRAMFMSSNISSQMSTTSLLSGLLEALRVPIVAAGGIASHSHVKAMLQLGASGVQVGTSYLLCDEAKTSNVHKAVLRAKECPTAITNLFSGRLARGIRNKLMDDFGAVSTDTPDFPFASIALGPLRSRAESLGLSDFSPLWAGEDRSGCKEISAKELTHNLWFGNNSLMTREALGLHSHKVEIEIDDLADGEVERLLREHLRLMHKYSPPDSIHALDPNALRRESITFFSARIANTLAACGALKELNREHAEIKSMKTSKDYLRKGIAREMLSHILQVAQTREYLKVSLETGSSEAFLPARNLYEQFGFKQCRPFADYVFDPYSTYYEMDLS